MKKAIALLAATAVVSVAGAAVARDTVSIVGSSTVFPFSKAVAERFGKTTDFKAPIVEATGSGGGLKLFCSGVGTNTPDITNASRRIKASELETCNRNGITVTEIKVGFDGIVLANSVDAPVMSITRKQIFQALAAKVPMNDACDLQDNPYKMWSDISADLPNVAIEVLGPPPTSGTRDAFVELVMREGAEAFPCLKAFSKERFRAVADSIREDGAYIETGENDTLIVNKLAENMAAFGIFGFSFLDQNSDSIQGAYVDGVEPDFDLIADGEYPVSRSLYVYLKGEHVGVVAGIQEFAQAFTNEGAIGEEGYLLDKGLIPQDEEGREAARNAANTLVPLTELSHH